ncbi:hypothetical protein COU60_02565 [Candidatus Pacearchaeota archaeon CG10_big_fil_rev_8_21_14_0_10_34_76]|nr:MAG: hypothetical protein COU60_02565 [Candidatus Pacearchaeota archaeon CG10_big_fil_rev_8_21_14_0_10_34_76]
MDCCSNISNSENSEGENKMKGGFIIKMDKRIVLWIVIGALFLIALFMTFQAGIGGSVGVAQSTGSAAQSAASTMVGGC